MKWDVLSVGMTVIDLLTGHISDLPPADGLLELDSFQISTGGVASTYARDIAKLGLSCGLVSSVGDDLLGKLGFEMMASDGVHMDEVIQIDKGKTGTSIVLIDPLGERRFLYFPGVVDELKSPEEVDLALYRHVHIGGAPLVSKYTGKEGLKFLKRAHDDGLSTSLDTVMTTRDEWASVRKLLSEIDIAMPSYIEANMLTGEKEPLKQARNLLEYGVQIAVIKLGASGALFWKSGSRPYLIEPPSIQVVDTTGAGEAFCAGFTYGWLSGWDFLDSGIFAVTCGSLATQGFGGPTAIKRHDEVMKWAAENGFQPKVKLVSP